MQNSEKEIVLAIDKIFVPGTYYYSQYIVDQLRKKENIQLIAEIIDISGKTITEAVLVFLASVRYLKDSINALKFLEAANQFEHFVQENKSQILELSIQGKVQGNLPERALPVIDIINRQFPGEKISVIELGASFGLIGQFLLDPQNILKKNRFYFLNNQQYPTRYEPIYKYLGIDISVPEKKWLISCFSNTDDAFRIEKFINNLNPSPNFDLIEKSAIGFSSISKVKYISNENTKRVVLTSFMLYQLEETLQKQLTNEIVNFCEQTDAHWIKQEVDLSNAEFGPDYYISLDNKRIISLQDDKCTSWKWID